MIVPVASNPPESVAESVKIGELPLDSVTRPGLGSVVRLGLAAWT